MTHKHQARGKRPVNAVHERRELLSDMLGDFLAGKDSRLLELVDSMVADSLEQRRLALLAGDKATHDALTHSADALLLVASLSQFAKVVFAHLENRGGNDGHV